MQKSKCHVNKHSSRVSSRKDNKTSGAQISAIFLRRPEPSLLAHTSSESRGTFRQKARFLAPLNGWACAVKVCHDGMLEDTNSLDGAQIILIIKLIFLYYLPLETHKLYSDLSQ